MRCKQQRKMTENRRSLERELLSQLKKFNPKRYFMTNGDEIHVDTLELWKLTLPEDWNILIGKTQQEIKYWGYMKISKEDCTVCIYGW